MMRRTMLSLRMRKREKRESNKLISIPRTRKIDRVDIP